MHEIISRLSNLSVRSFLVQFIHYRCPNIGRNVLLHLFKLAVLSHYKGYVSRPIHLYVNVSDWPIVNASLDISLQYSSYPTFGTVRLANLTDNRPRTEPADIRKESCSLKRTNSVAWLDIRYRVKFNTSSLTGVRCGLSPCIQNAMVGWCNSIRCFAWLHD